MPPARPTTNSIDTVQPASSTMPNPRTTSKSALKDRFVVSVVVKVDEATEPGLSEATATRHRDSLINVLTNRNHDLPSPVSSITPGEAVSFALRKRLKSENRLAVLNTLILLDEIMRSVPYFYRDVANDKFFRRLWRFVVPDYKNQVRSIIPLFTKPRINAAMRASDGQISERVKILIRAWAEELSVMFHGRYDPHAGFLIERYRNKRSRVPFPEVPSTPTPWICPVSSNTIDPTSRRSGSAARAGSANPDLAAITLAEVENTVNLFTNMLEKATDISELRDDLCADLAARCQSIVDNLAHLSMNMDKEEELARAVKTSELLEQSLARYRSCISANRIVQEIPTIAADSLESDDELYEPRVPARRAMSARSLDGTASSPDAPRSNRTSRERVSNYPTRSVSFSRISSKAPDGRSRSQDLSAESSFSRHNNELSNEDHDASRKKERSRDDRAADRSRERERTLDREDMRERERRSDRDRERNREREREDDRDRSRERTSKPRKSSDRMRSSNASGSSSSSYVQRPPFARREKSDGDLPTISKRKEKLENNLIDVADDDDEDEVDGPAESFQLLAERYTSQKPAKAKKKTGVKGKGKPPVQRPNTSAAPAAPSQPTTTEASAGTPNGTSPGMTPAAMYGSTVPGMGLNPMMMMPNPYSMYSSISGMPMPMPMGDPMGVFGAYSTVNPGMYYSSVNPQMMSMPTTNAADVSAATDTTGATTAANTQSPPPAAPAPSVTTGMAAPAPTSVAGVQAPGVAGMGGTMGMPMGSFYGSVHGGMPMMAAPPPPPPPAPAQGNALIAVGPVGPVAQAAESGHQAAAYQSAMQQAAAAYHMAANAYRSVQGQAMAAPSMAVAGPGPMGGHGTATGGASADGATEGGDGREGGRG